MHFFRDSGVSSVLESLCMPYTLRFSVRCFLALTKKLLFLEVPCRGIGAGIGLSVGALLFYLLVHLAPRWRQNSCLILLALLGANMLSQASRGLMQADWLPSGQHYGTVHSCCLKGPLLAILPSGSNFEVEAYEVEALWQLTEQGEYWADWGVLFELERERREDVWGFGSGFLIEKEFSDWSVTGNLLFIYEWGDDINDELESSTAVQVRYRYSRQFEPAIEVYFGGNTHALGPVMLGQINLGIRKTLNWETGVLFGLDSSSPNRSVRMLLEF